jgi:tetratricopeptide (TPR) repeat protein
MNAGPPVAEDARAYLRAQTRLAKLQCENLLELNTFELSHLRWRRFNDQMWGLLQILTVAVAALVVISIAADVWSAAHDNGLVIETFSVPSDLAARGLTGEVVATKMLDHLSYLQTQTVSIRAASSYANNWGDDIKVQIPDTGVSIGELNRDLRSWLGNETHIAGAVYHTPKGIAVTARAGSLSSAVFTGGDADIDSLIGKAAEAVYRTTQPYRYAVYLDQHGHPGEANALYMQLIATGSQTDRAYAYSALANDIPPATGDYAKARLMVQMALATEPDQLLARENLITIETQLQHDEQALKAIRDAIAVESRGRDPTMDETYFRVDTLNDEAKLAAALGDYRAAMDFNRQVELRPDHDGTVEAARETNIAGCGVVHDAQCLREALAALPPVPAKSFAALARLGNAQVADAGLGHWRDLLAIEKPMTDVLTSTGTIGRVFLDRAELPYTALAHAHLGDFAQAHREIDQTPVDCGICLRDRGLIDMLQKRWSGAAFWFARATEQAPSPPFAYADWGRMLLAKGDVDGAIEKFRAANSRGPHFADALEMWGEALMAKNRADLALAKFEEANRYTPNWGRLHLEWGEALSYAGKRDDAKKQFALAASLDLSPADRASLGKWMTHG